MTSLDTPLLRAAVQAALADLTSAEQISLISLGIFLGTSLAAAEAAQGTMDR